MTTIPFPVCLAVATAIAFIMEQSNLLFATFYYGILIFVAYFLVEPEPREIDFDAIDSYVNRPTDESLQSLEREEKHIEKPTEAIAIPKIEAIVSDHKKRALRIEEELTQIIKETQEEELGEEMEQEAIAALLKGALRTTHLKKYYDVFKDEFMYLPPVAKALIDYTLLEEAEKHYVDEEDEFPDFYSGCLRAVASNHLDEDMDYEYLYDIAVPIDGIVVQDSSPADAPVQADPNDTVTELEKQVTDKPAIDPNKERSLRIETELNEIIQETETEELGEEMEPEAIAALHKGALRTTHLKKYYDVFKDEFMFLPPVAKALLDYTLIEEAEKEYFDKEDEFPELYSGCLRTVSSNHLDADLDYDYLDMLAIRIEGIDIYASSADVAEDYDAKEEAKLKQLQEARLQVEAEQAAKLQAQQEAHDTAQALEEARLRAADEDKRKALEMLKAEALAEARIKKAYSFNGYKGNVGYVTTNAAEGGSLGTMRVRLSNQATDRVRDLLVPISSDVSVAEAIYKNDAVREANIRKWPKDLAQEVKTKISVVQCLLIGNGSSHPIQIFSVADMEATTTADLYDLTSSTADTVKMVLKCTRVEPQSSGLANSVEWADAADSKDIEFSGESSSSSESSTSSSEGSEAEKVASVDRVATMSVADESDSEDRASASSVESQNGAKQLDENTVSHSNEQEDVMEQRGKDEPPCEEEEGDASPLNEVKTSGNNIATDDSEEGVSDDSTSKEEEEECVEAEIAAAEDGDGDSSASDENDVTSPDMKVSVDDPEDNNSVSSSSSSDGDEEKVDIPASNEDVSSDEENDSDSRDSTGDDGEKQVEDALDDSKEKHDVAASHNSKNFESDMSARGEEEGVEDEIATAEDGDGDSSASDENVKVPVDDRESNASVGSSSSSSDGDEEKVDISASIEAVSSDEEESVVKADELDRDGGDFTAEENSDRQPQKEVTSSDIEEQVEDSSAGSKAKQDVATSNESESVESDATVQGDIEGSDVADAFPSESHETVDGNLDSGTPAQHNAKPTVETGKQHQSGDSSSSAQGYESRPQEEMISVIDEIEQDVDEYPTIASPHNHSIESTVVERSPAEVTESSASGEPREMEDLIRATVETNNAEKTGSAGDDDGSQSSNLHDSTSSFKSPSILEKRRKKRELEAFRLSMPNSPAGSTTKATVESSKSSRSPSAGPGAFFGRFFGNKKDEEEK